MSTAVTVLLTLQLCSNQSIPTYHMSPTTSNWFEAAEYCHRQGMRLAIIDTAAKQQAVVAKAKAANLYQSGFFGIWLGATDMARTRVFTWQHTGERIQYSAWKRGEPSGGNEHCVCLYYWPLYAFEWTWNDAPCDTSLYAMCETYKKESCIDLVK